MSTAVRRRGRNVGIDALRVLSIVAVVAGHLPLPEPVRSSIYLWHVPLFFFLSGWFHRPGRTLRAEAAGRWATLLKPYLFWLAVISVPYLTVLVVQGRFSALTVPMLLWGGAFLISPFSAFWFMSALFVAALAYRAVEARGGRPELSLALGVAGCVAATVAPQIVSKAPLALGSAVVALVFLWAGHRLRRVARRWPSWVCVLLAVVPVGAAAAGWIAPLDLKAADVGTPVVSLLAATAVCAGLTSLAERLPRPPLRPRVLIGRLATTGTGVIYLHALLIWSGLLQSLPTALELVAVLAVCWCAALALRLLPLEDWTLGLRQAPRARRLSPAR